MAAEILLKMTPGYVGVLSGTAAEGYASLRAGAGVLNTSVGQLSTSSLLKLRT